MSLRIDRLLTQAVIRRYLTPRLLTQAVIPQEKISPTEFSTTLKLLGSEDTSVVMVHSSLKMAGVNAPVEAILQSIIDSFPQSDILFPKFRLWGTMKTSLERLQGKDIFKSASTTGALSIVASKDFGAATSIHPTHAIAALGPNSLKITHNHENDQYVFSEKSPFNWLRQKKGKILFLGVDFEVMTFVHCVEAVHREKFGFVFNKQPSQIEFQSNAEAYKKSYYCTRPILAKFRMVERLRNHLLAKGYISEYRHHGIVITLVDAPGVEEVMLDLYDTYGATIYG